VRSLNFIGNGIDGRAAPDLTTSMFDRGRDVPLAGPTEAG
jgi:hypothetical protein